VKPWCFFIIIFEYFISSTTNLGLSIWYYIRGKTVVNI
jgi:hypothetical protein